MTNEARTEASPKSLEQVLEEVPELQDQETLDGLTDLITKAAPLIQGRRLHNIVDLLAAASDVIEMADDAMVQKLMALYEEGMVAPGVSPMLLDMLQLRLLTMKPSDDMEKPTPAKQR